ncbi:hypothetical protein Emed_006705 [Eimeria media]
MAFACKQRGRQWEKAPAAEPLEAADGGARSSASSPPTYKSEAPSFAGCLGRFSEAAAPSEGRGHEASSLPVAERQPSRDAARDSSSFARRISASACSLTLLIYCLYCIVGAAGEGHHHEKNPAAKSLALRKKTLYAPQPLAGEVLLSCPFGFDMVEGDCVKAEIMKPQWICDVGVAEGPVCVQRQVTPPSAQCPAGFVLEQGKCVRWTRTGVTYECPSGFETLGDPQSPICYLDREVAGIPSCRPPFVLQGGVCLHKDRYEPVPICPEGFHYDKETGQCRRVRLGRSVPQCKEGWTYVEERNKCVMEEEPTLICPPKSNHFLTKGGAPALAKDGCAEVETETPVYACHEGETAVFVGSDDRSGALPPGAPPPPPLAQGPPVVPAKGLSKHHKGKGGLGPDWGAQPPPLEGPLEDKQGALLELTHDKSKAPLGVGKGLGKHQKGKAGLGVEWGPPPPSLEGSLDEVQQGALLGASLDKGEPLPNVAATAVGGKGFSKHHKGKGGKGVEWGSPPSLPEGAPAEQQGALLGPLPHDKSKSPGWGHSKKAAFADVALLTEEGPRHTKDATQLTGGIPKDGSTTGMWQRRAWGPSEAASPPLAVGEVILRRLQGKKGAAASWDEVPPGKEPPITGKGEEGPPHTKGWPVEAGKEPVHKAKGKKGGPPVIEAPQMLCETLEVSLEALRLECPPGSTPTVSKVLGGQSCREIKRQPAQAVCEIPGAELQVDGFCLWVCRWLPSRLVSRQLRCLASC